MKVLLDIKDDKAEFFLDLLKDIKYVKAQQLTDTKSRVLSELREAVEEMQLIKAGKKKGRPAKDVLNEL